jgi:hypothetical protein
MVGLFVLILGLAAAAAAWGAPLGGDPRIRPVVAACAALVVLGGALLILPSPREERLGRFEDLWDMSAFQMITTRWWVVIALALAVGAGNYAVVSGDWIGLRRIGETSLAGAAPTNEPARRAESNISAAEKTTEVAVKRGE